VCGGMVAGAAAAHAVSCCNRRKRNAERPLAPGAWCVRDDLMRAPSLTPRALSHLASQARSHAPAAVGIAGDGEDEQPEEQAHHLMALPEGDLCLKSGRVAKLCHVRLPPYACVARRSKC